MVSMLKDSKGRKRKKFIALRLRGDVLKALETMSKRANKTKTRIMEEAILLHAKDLV